MMASTSGIHGFVFYVSRYIYIFVYVVFLCYIKNKITDRYRWKIWMESMEIIINIDVVLRSRILKR